MLALRISPQASSNKAVMQTRVSMLSETGGNSHFNDSKVNPNGDCTCTVSWNRTEELILKQFSWHSWEKQKSLVKAKQTWKTEPVRRIYAAKETVSSFPYTSLQSRMFYTDWICRIVNQIRVNTVWSTHNFHMPSLQFCIPHCYQCSVFADINILQTDINTTDTTNHNHKFLLLTRLINSADITLHKGIKYFSLYFIKH